MSPSKGVITLKILAVDDEKLALEYLSGAIMEAVPNAKLYAFQDASAALEQFASDPCDIAFLDIQMRSISGLDFAQKLQKINKQVNIIFCSGYSEYSMDAFRLYASDYLLKPVSADKIRNSLNHLRHPLPFSRPNSRIYIKCFGKFEVYCGQDVLTFKRTKSKELLAYLVNRLGTACTMGEIMSVLWENGPDSSSRSSNLRNVISDLKKSLSAVGAEDVLIKTHNTIRLNCSAVDCDYFDYLQKNGDQSFSYNGEYMAQYSWAEITMGNLVSFPRKED